MCKILKRKKQLDLEPVGWKGQKYPGPQISPRLGASANLGPTGWDNRDMVWSGYDQKLLQTQLCHLLDV